MSIPGEHIRADDWKEKETEFLENTRILEKLENLRAEYSMMRTMDAMYAARTLQVTQWREEAVGLITRATLLGKLSDLRAEVLLGRRSVDEQIQECFSPMEGGRPGRPGRMRLIALRERLAASSENLNVSLVMRRRAGERIKLARKMQQTIEARNRVLEQKLREIKATGSMNMHGRGDERRDAP
jgi:hypothetical protein